MTKQIPIWSFGWIYRIELVWRKPRWVWRDGRVCWITEMGFWVSKWIEWYRAGFSERIGFGFGGDREKPEHGLRLRDTVIKTLSLISDELVGLLYLCRKQWVCVKSREHLHCWIGYYRSELMDNWRAVRLYMPVGFGPILVSKLYYFVCFVSLG